MGVELQKELEKQEEQKFYQSLEYTPSAFDSARFIAKVFHVLATLELIIGFLTCLTADGLLVGVSVISGGFVMIGFAALLEVSASSAASNEQTAYYTKEIYRFQRYRARESDKAPDDAAN